MPRAKHDSASAQVQQDANSEGIDAYELPKSLVTRIARSGLPDNVKMQKDTVLAISKGSAVFVNYLAATAHDVAASKQHKSISASDVLKALELAHFGDMVPKLQIELQAYRDLQKSDKGRKSGSRAKPKDGESASGTTAKAKGKEKTEPTPKITISVSRLLPTGAPLAADPPPEDEDVGMEEQSEDDIEEEDVEEDVEEGAEEDEGDEDADDGVEDDHEISEDKMAVEDEEVVQDSRGLDAGPSDGMDDS